MEQKIQHQECSRATKAMRFIFCLFFPIGMLCACSNSDETIINPEPSDMNRRAPIVNVQKVTASEDITAFFSSALPSGGKESEEFFTTLGYHSDICCFVNSPSELQSLYVGSKPLPEINFEENTLVIGKVMLTGGCEIGDIDIEDNDNEFVVNLTVTRYIDKTAATAFFPNYYWGLFEKLPSKEIIVKTNIKDVSGI